MEDSLRRFKVDLASGANSLAAYEHLASIDGANSFHVSRRLRAPLGIYNVSISRVCDKLHKFCSHLEAYIGLSDRVKDLDEHREQLQILVDYVELSLYSAAEHIADIEAIVAGFYRHPERMRADPAARKFKSAVKLAKVFIAGSANAIKHQQARIRVYSADLIHGGTACCLHGYFIEGVAHGVIGPSEVFHNKEKVFSLSSLAWEVVVLVLCCSEALNEYLSSLPNAQPAPTDGSIAFQKAVIGAARLPLFSFDEAHPFERFSVDISCDEGARAALAGQVYGSFARRWVETRDVIFGGSVSSFEGDGSSRSFTVVGPKRVQIRQWPAWA